MQHEAAPGRRAAEVSVLMGRSNAPGQVEQPKFGGVVEVCPHVSLTCFFVLPA